MKRRLLNIFILILAIQSCSVTNILNKKAKEEVKKEAKEEAKEPEKVWGIDISHYQEIVDWNKILEHEPGFIFVKATEGTTIQDPKYPEYYKSVRKLGIPVGSYHFFTYKSPGKDQAKNFLATAKLQRGDLPLVLDAEFSRTIPEKNIVKKELLDFMKVIYDKTGLYPIIYCPYTILSDLPARLPATEMQTLDCGLQKQPELRLDILANYREIQSRRHQRVC